MNKLMHFRHLVVFVRLYSAQFATVGLKQLPFDAGVLKKTLVVHVWHVLFEKQEAHGKVHRKQVPSTFF